MSTRAGRVPAAQSTGKGALGTHDESKLFPSGNRAQFYGAPFWQARTSNRTGQVRLSKQAPKPRGRLVPRATSSSSYPPERSPVRLQTLYSRQLLATETSEVPAIKRRAKRWGGRGGPRRSGGTRGRSHGVPPVGEKVLLGFYSSIKPAWSAKCWKSWSRVIRGTP